MFRGYFNEAAYLAHRLFAAESDAAAHATQWDTQCEAHNGTHAVRQRVKYRTRHTARHP